MTKNKVLQVMFGVFVIVGTVGLLAMGKTQADVTALVVAAVIVFAAIGGIIAAVKS